MSENITPLEWLWQQLTERIGPEETAALREGYKAQLRHYQKRKKEEKLKAKAERKTGPGDGGDEPAHDDADNAASDAEGGEGSGGDGD